MTLKTSIINIERDLHIFFIEAGSFPEGIEVAHLKFKEIIGQSNNRIFYGISRPENNKIIYRAGAEEQLRGEAEKYNCNSLILKKGKYASVRIENYSEDPTLIGKAFDVILHSPHLDPQGYCVEQYLNEQELICMVRLEI